MATETSSTYGGKLTLWVHSHGKKNVPAEISYSTVEGRFQADFLADLCSEENRSHPYALEVFGKLPMDRWMVVSVNVWWHEEVGDWTYDRWVIEVLEAKELEMELEAP